MTRNTALTPAEALALLDMKGAKGTDAAKVTLMSLLAERRLRMDQVTEKKAFGRTQVVSKMSVANDGGALPPHVASMLRIVREAQPVAMKDFVKRAVSTYGSGFNGFLRKFVMPALAARGFAAERARTLLWIFKVRRYELTPGGEMEKRRLEGLMAQARDIPTFLDSDPKKAAAIAVALGAAIFLIPELRPHLQEIGAAMRPPSNSDSGGSGGDSSSPSSSADTGANTDVEFSSQFDLASFDDAALESLSMDMDSFDSSFDSASSDSGGGDGGGGDGGGGGGD